MKFFLSKIKYLGQVINEKGRIPDPNRADAIKYSYVKSSVESFSQKRHKMELDRRMFERSRN